MRTVGIKISVSKPNLVLIQLNPPVKVFSKISTDNYFRVISCNATAETASGIALSRIVSMHFMHYFESVLSNSRKRDVS